MQAQLGFEHEEIVFDKGILSNLARTTVGDLDGDGDMDVIAARFTSYQRQSNIVWYENLDGLGNYGEMKAVYGDLTGTSDVHVADLDGDGDMDILAASGDDDNVVWYENEDGLGNFGPQQLIANNAPDALRITAGDLDSDGDLDVMVIYLRSFSYDRLVWYENLDGLGDFGPEQILVENPSIVDMTIVDIDGDLDNDVVYSAGLSNRTLGFLRNIDGQGNFGSPGPIAGNSEDNYNSIAMIDVDGDGDLDAFYSYYDKIAWKENEDGLGTFGTEQIINQSVYAKRLLYSIDVDGDGDMDLIEGATQLHKISWYENTNGLGSFGAEQIVTTKANGVKSLAAAQIDGDNDVDIVSASNNNKLVWYSNKDGAGTYGLPISVSKNAISITALAHGDIDLDGDMDLISCSSFDKEIAWYENRDGQGDFKHQHIITNELNGPKGAFLEDMDGDGDLDIVGYHTGTHYVFWYENEDGLGTFGPIKNIAEFIQGINNLQVADFDNDGDIDVLTQATTEPKLAIYKNNGQGIFGSPIAIATTNYSGNDIHITDLDTDGDLDFLVSQNGALFWFKNMDGQATFEFQDYISVNINAINAISSGDMDGDGYEDIVVSGIENTNSKVWWLKNLDGQGNFSPRNFITNATQESDVTVADLDSDGDMDVIYRGDYTISWSENLDGLGNFAAGVVLTPDGPGGSKPIHVADLNGDGSMDVVSGEGFTLNLIGWYKNMGSLANTIMGNIKFDSQNDGCDSTDNAISNAMVITNDGTDNNAVFTKTDGTYEFPVAVGSYTTSAGSNLSDYFSVTPTSHISVFTEGGNTDAADFCISPFVTANDLSVSIFPLDIAKPRYYVTYKIIYENLGTTIRGGSVQFAYEEEFMNFTEANPVPTATNGNVFTWDFSDLRPFETKSIEITFKIADPPIVEVGDILHFTVIVNPIGSDETPEDNVFKFNHLVKNYLFDNRMDVSEDREIPIEKADEYLHYTIRFKNPGSTTITNLRIEDVLDEKLDWTTLKILDQSHTLETHLVNEKIFFQFDDINLSPEPEENEGFVLFKVKPLPIIVANDEIENQASLYFDLLPAITTNTVATKYVEGLDIPDFKILNVLAYPNPTNDILNIQAEGSISSIEIMNLLGQTLLTSQGNSSREQVDISGLAAGNYFVKVVVGEASRVLRVVVY
ncbi:MAG: T9SS type A sorting domain-containing protein [Aequorivita sp.]|nr:T9SS type A sorting domain-containing protein [Aequorivita sp.]